MVYHPDRPPGNGDTSPEELARYALAQQEQRARDAEGRQLRRQLSGSRTARQRLGQQWAPVTAVNNADDRRNGGGTGV